MCRGSTLSADGRLLANVRNEGGFTGAIDLGQDLDNSQFEDLHPELWKKETLLALCECSEPEDFDEAEALLRDEGVDPNAASDDGTTGLHMAASNNSVEWASLCMSPPLHPPFPANWAAYD
jgi:ankyrin repeat protein